MPCTSDSAPPPNQPAKRWSSCRSLLSGVVRLVVGKVELEGQYALVRPVNRDVRGQRQIDPGDRGPRWDGVVEVLERAEHEIRRRRRWHSSNNRLARWRLERIAAIAVRVMVGGVISAPIGLRIARASAEEAGLARWRG